MENSGDKYEGVFINRFLSSTFTPGSTFKLVTAAAALLRDPSAAEELAQEVFLKLHRNISCLSTDAHVVHWLRKVTCHRVIDRLRRFKSHPEIDFESIPEPSVPCYQDDPMLLEHVRKLVASLPDDLRTVIVLRYQDLELKQHEETLNGHFARVLQHEIDHLNGVLIVDRAIDGLYRYEEEEEEQPAEAGGGGEDQSEELQPEDGELDPGVELDTLESQPVGRPRPDRW